MKVCRGTCLAPTCLTVCVDPTSSSCLLTSYSCQHHWHPAGLQHPSSASLSGGHTCLLCVNSALLLSTFGNISSAQVAHQIRLSRIRHQSSRADNLLSENQRFQLCVRRPRSMWLSLYGSLPMCGQLGPSYTGFPTDFRSGLGTLTWPFKEFSTKDQTALLWFERYTLELI